MPDLGIAAKEASGLPAVLKELPTELKVCYVLITFLLACDVFVFRAAGTNVLKYDWSLGKGVTFGGALFFLAVYAFFTRVVCAFLMLPLRLTLFLLESCLRWIGKNWTWLPKSFSACCFQVLVTTTQIGIETMGSVTTVRCYIRVRFMSTI